MYISIKFIFFCDNFDVQVVYKYDSDTHTNKA